jgi:hypothetical protein
MPSTSIVGTGLGHPYDEFIRSPNFTNAVAMTLASSAASIPIPPGAVFVRLASNQDAFYCFGTTGAATAASSDGLRSLFQAAQAGPIFFNIGSSLGTTAMSVISTAPACTVTASWWS